MALSPQSQPEYSTSYQRKQQHLGRLWVPNQSSMGSSEGPQPTYIVPYEGANKIQEGGCLSLSKSKWKHLFFLNLRNNFINYQGCLYLSQADWPEIDAIDLSKIFFISSGQQRSRDVGSRGIQRKKGENLLE